MTTTLERITYPTDLAVSEEEVKRYLLVKKLPTDVATDLTEQIREAIDQAEGWSRRSFMSSRFKLTLDEWPANCVIPLDRYPLNSVSSVKYRDQTTGDWTPMTVGTDFNIDKDSKPARLIMLNTPGLHTDYLSKVEIIFTAGANNSILVPLRAKRAVKLLVATSFENRQDEVVKGMTKAEMLCRSIAIRRF